MSNTLKAWPNLALFGRLKDVPRNVFRDKLDHCIDFSYDIMARVDDLGCNCRKVTRRTEELGPAGLIVTKYYEIEFRKPEDVTAASLVLAGLLGTDTGTRM